MTAPSAVLQVAADSVTGKALVVLQDRPVVSFGAWLTGALRECAETGRGLQIVTPPTSRLSLPLRIVVAGRQATWVVRGAGPGAVPYDGLSGAPLRWDGAAYVPQPGASDYAPDYLARPAVAIGSQLTLTLRVRYGGYEQFGGVVERLCLALQGTPPAGWGTAEPVVNPWNRAELTNLCRGRPGTATWLTVVGSGPPPGPAAPGHPPALIGTMLYTPIPGGMEEAATIVAGYPATAQLPTAWLPSMVGELAAEHRLLSLSAQLGPGPVDLTAEPRWTGSPAPIGLAVAPELGGGSAVPDEIPARPAGPLWWYELGDGRSADGWQRYQSLMSALQPR